MQRGTSLYSLPIFYVLLPSEIFFFFLFFFSSVFSLMHRPSENILHRLPSNLLAVSNCLEDAGGVEVWAGITELWVAHHKTPSVSLPSIWFHVISKCACAEAAAAHEFRIMWLFFFSFPFPALCFIMRRTWVGLLQTAAAWPVRVIIVITIIIIASRPFEHLKAWPAGKDFEIPWSLFWIWIFEKCRG